MIWFHVFGSSPITLAHFRSSNLLEVSDMKSVVRFPHREQLNSIAEPHSNLC